MGQAKGDTHCRTGVASGKNGLLYRRGLISIVIYVLL